MSLFQAIVWLDHHHEEILQFDATQVTAQQVKSHIHYTRRHDSKTHSEHAFFSEICEALSGVDPMLVAGSAVAQAEFRHYVEKFQPLVAARVVRWQTLDHPSASELIALARRYFMAHSEVAAGQFE
ncbi:hypothetical protein VLK31_19645 [Variovorax sp. H27-G14]|uniref:hypothetical protein n=1 Tax=Variovorax sp. H27-G14 TaxID=3111914 RepID=UPI0038FC7404